MADAIRGATANATETVDLRAVHRTLDMTWETFCAHVQGFEFETWQVHMDEAMLVRVACGV